MLYNFHVPENAIPGEYRLDFIASDKNNKTGIKSFIVKVIPNGQINTTTGDYEGAFIQEAHYDQSKNAVIAKLNKATDSKLEYKIYQSSTNLDFATASPIKTGSLTGSTSFTIDVSALTKNTDFMARLWLYGKATDGKYTQNLDYFEIFFHITDVTAAKTAIVTLINEFLDKVKDNNTTTTEILTYFLPDSTMQQIAEKVWTPRIKGLDFNVDDHLTYDGTPEITFEGQGFATIKLYNFSVVATPKTTDGNSPALYFSNLKYPVLAMDMNGQKYTVNENPAEFNAVLNPSDSKWYLVEKQHNELTDISVDDSKTILTAVVNFANSPESRLNAFINSIVSFNPSTGDFNTLVNDKEKELINTYYTPFNPDFQNAQREPLHELLAASSRNADMRDLQPVNIHGTGQTLSFDIETSVAFNFTVIENGVPMDKEVIHHFTWSKIDQDNDSNTPDVWYITDAWIEANEFTNDEQQVVTDAVKNGLKMMNMLKRT